MQSAPDSAIGLPSRSTSAARMLGFVTPPDVSSNFIIPLLDDVKGAERLLQLSSLKQYKASWVDVLEYRTNDLCGQAVGMCGCVDRVEQDKSSFLCRSPTSRLERSRVARH